MLVISAALPRMPADTQAMACQSPRAAPEGSSILRKPPVRTSQISSTPHRAMAADTTHGRKSGPTPA